MSKRGRNAFESAFSPLTSTHEGRTQWQPWPTPTKAKIQGAVEYLERHKISYSKRDVFDTFNISKRRGWAILINKDLYPRRCYNDPLKIDIRERSLKLSNQDLAVIDRIL
jgi:hypothetical protein